jgi:hypothetical protein
MTTKNVWRRLADAVRRGLPRPPPVEYDELGVPVRRVAPVAVPVRVRKRGASPRVRGAGPVAFADRHRS